MTNIYNFTKLNKPFDIQDLNTFMYNLMDNLSVPINKYTIYIPTKGRAGIAKTMSMLDRENIKYVLVVEPQDYDTYVTHYPNVNILQLDVDDMGVVYARNYIKKYSRSVGESKHWQMDDDLEKFFIRKHNATKNTPVSPLECIHIVETCTDLFSNVAISGMDGPTYAFSKKYGVQLNRDPGGCVLIDNTVDADWDYRSTEDIHYSLSVLEAGYCTLRFSHVMVQSAPPMKNPGGNTDADYKSFDKLKEAYENLIRRWPDKISLKENPPNKPIRWVLRRKFYKHYNQQLQLINDQHILMDNPTKTI
jgi:hypothetical protein